MKEEITNEELEKMSDEQIIGYAQKATPKMWHQMVMRSNWYSSIALLDWLVDNPETDKATILMLYWKSGPRYYKQFKDRDDFLKNHKAWMVDDFDFLEKVEENYTNGFYQTQNFEFDPNDWANYDSDKPQLREIPAIMFQKLNGEQVEYLKDTMAKEITSKIIGLLKQDIFPDWWKSNEIEIPFFDNKKLPVIFLHFEPKHDTTFIEEADQALTNFLNLKTEDRNAISEPVYKNCTDFFEATGFNEEVVKMFQKIENPQHWELQTIKRGGLLNLPNVNDVWQFVYPTTIYATRRPDKDKDIYIQIACECDWEDEHGLQLVYRQGKKITRISAQDGHLTEADAYDKPDEEDELLSKF